MDERAAATDAANRTSRFELAPPRHFVLPAILLLLSEEAGYGYRLVKDLEELRFGRIDRPSVYRALSQLEADALVESWLETPTAGQTRRVYGLTPLGARVLRAWMGVIKEERDGLDRVLRRYQATGTIDAVLAEVDGGWAAGLRSTFSPVSPTSPARRRRAILLNQFEEDQAGEPADAQPAATPAGAGDEAHQVIDVTISAVPPSRRPGQPGSPRPNSSVSAPSSHSVSPTVPPSDRPGSLESVPPPSERPPGRAKVPAQKRFRLVPDRSVVMIEVRSSVGPISFGAVGLTGWIDATVGHGVIRPGSRPKAHVQIAIDGLSSGNNLYDAELLRRIDARRFPHARIDLRETVAIGTASRYRLAGELEFHGVTRAVNGTVDVAVLSDERLMITGEQVFDIRDYDVQSPAVLMLRIYPDVRLHLHVEAELDAEA